MSFHFALRDVLSLATAFEALISLSDISIEVPSGQTMEQKNLPKTMVRATMTTPGRSTAINPLVVMMVVIRMSGSILRKRSTGTGNTRGKAAYKRRIRKTTKLAA